VAVCPQDEAIARRTHRYGDHPDQHGELFLPRGEPRAGVAVVLHGGFWRARYDRRLMDGLCEDLARARLPVWNLEYRRLPEGGWPKTFDDVAAGIDALAAIDVDSSRVVAIGHSAGGHLALWAAARPGVAPRMPVSHVVSQAGVADLQEAARLELSAGVVPDFLGGTPDEVPERYAAASPAERLPLGVPQLVVHGGRDRTVPPSISRDYTERAIAAGDDVELVIDSRSGHYEHLDPSSELWRAVCDWLDRRFP
jgi:acetyl esterase/lipase